MAETAYPYTVSTETAIPAGPPENGNANLDLLAQEIADSAMTAPAKADYMHAGQSAGVVTVVFANALSGADETLLDAVMLAHAGTITTADPQLLRMSPFDTPVTQGDATFTTKLQLVCPPLKKGVWSLKIRGELALNPTSLIVAQVPDSAADMRVLIDGAERVSNTEVYADFDDKGTSDDIEFVEGAAPDIEIQIRRRSGTARDAEFRRGVISMVFVGTDE